MDNDILYPSTIPGQQPFSYAHFVGSSSLSHLMSSIAQDAITAFARSVDISSVSATYSNLFPGRSLIALVLVLWCSPTLVALPVYSKP
jgi:hypothetical protein